MKEILREYISQQIRSNCFDNIPLTTKRIKEYYQGASNSKIFDELWMLENLEIVCIKQAARSRKSYKDRENWLQWKHKICRYIIDILKPEYFNVTPVSASDWAIKAFVDTEKWDFVLQFNGIDEDVRIDLKPRKGNKKSLLRDFWEQAQNKVNEWCECPFAKPHTSISTFFGRFCKELQPYFIEFKKGGYEARFTPVIYPQVIMAKGVKEFVFLGGTDIDVHYKCKFDENGNFIGWHKC